MIRSGREQAALAVILSVMGLLLRATVNYVLNHLGGDTAFQKDSTRGPAAINGGNNEHELLLRTAVAL